MISSLRSTLLVGTSVTFLFTLGLLGIAVDSAIRRTLTAEFDAGLLAKAQALSSMVEQRGSQIQFEFDIHDMPEFADHHHPFYFELWIDGTTFSASPSLEKEKLLATVINTTAPSYSSIYLHATCPVRMVALPFLAHPEEGEPAPPRRSNAIIVVARDTESLSHTLEHLRITIATICFIAISCSSGIIVWVVRRSLRPLERVAGEIERLGEYELAHRIDIKGVPLEVRPVVDRLNDLLSRLEVTVERERSFTADVAHELRTPIAGIRTTLEVARLNPREPAEYVRIIDRCLHVTTSMQRMIENLLLLSRAETGQLQMRMVSVDLLSLSADAWENFIARAVEKKLRIEWKMPSSCVVQGDLENLRIVLHNLIDNAVSYSDEGGLIEISVSLLQGMAQFQISNTGCELEVDDMPHLFERFWRKEAARSQTGIHAGLGLSLVKRLLTLCGSRLIARTNNQCFIAEFQLPLAS